ncbi:hypothetical protein JCM24511_06905, partial [Saitozyma sp. JCM 24511]
ATYSGSLLNKRKAELVEIASALKLDADAKMTDMIKSIQGYLEAHEPELREAPMFKGLYGSRRGRASGGHGETDSEPSETVTGAIASATKKSRKSINKAIDRVTETIDAASIPLPETPIAVSKIQNAANETVSKALVPAQSLSKDITARLTAASDLVVKLTGDQTVRIEVAVRHLRDFLSHPPHLLTTAIALELLFLVSHVVQWYPHTFFFPPMGHEKGTIPALLHSIFFWSPKINWTITLPELRSFALDGHVWSAIAWWFSATVLPALAASTIVSFVPQKGIHRHAGAATRYQATHPPTPTVDPLSFALFRLALLIFPLTTAAPSSVVDALEMSGNPEGRALGAGLVAALVLADRLHA